MTSKNRSFRPSPALVISCVALFLALTGSALRSGSQRTASAQPRSSTAASAPSISATTRSTGRRSPPNAVTSEEIAENAVESPEVAQDALTNQDLGAASVASSEVADQSLTASDLGPDSVVASELGTVTVRTNATTVAKDANGTVSVSCAAGEQVLGGGGQPSHFGAEMTSSRPSGNGWLYQAQNKTGGVATITAFALCLSQLNRGDMKHGKAGDGGSPAFPHDSQSQAKGMTQCTPLLPTSEELNPIPYFDSSEVDSISWASSSSSSAKEVPKPSTGASTPSTPSSAASSSSSSRSSSPAARSLPPARSRPCGSA